MKKFILTVLVIFGLFPLKASAPHTNLEHADRYINYTEQVKKELTIKLAVSEMEASNTALLQKMFKESPLLNNADNKSAVEKTALKLNFNKEWLFKVLYKENRGCTKTINSLTGAAGIIQWLPSTALALGTSVEELQKMTFTEQLQFVEKYLIYNKVVGKINSYEDLYLAIFFPRALGKPDSYVMGIKPPLNMDRDSMSFVQKVYHGNSSIDINKDNLITVEDFKKFANKI